MKLKFLFLLSCFFAFAANGQQLLSQTLTPNYLRTEYKVDPFIDEAHPRLSWELLSAQPNQLQTAYQIVVAPTIIDLEKGSTWNSGKVKGNTTNQIEFNGRKLQSLKKYYWKVRSWDKDGKIGQWSKIATFETGLLHQQWQAKWIGIEQPSTNKTYFLPPASYFKKEQNLNKKITRARLYVTALGLYEFNINGKKIGDEYFAPGWTDYSKRVYYRAFDVTKYVKIGSNNFSAVLAPGWYAGYIGYAVFVKSPKTHQYYGKVPMLMAQVVVDYADGTHRIIGTDQTWKSGTGPILETDILQGETYDARLEQAVFKNAKVLNQLHNSVIPIQSEIPKEVQLYPGDPVKIVEEIKPIGITKKGSAHYIINFGQNFAGVIRLQVKGKEGNEVVLKYGEMLFPDGSLMIENLRKARATDSYILKGDPNGEMWQPQFTYHGFQYVEIKGVENVTSTTLTGLVMSSATAKTGTLMTDNPMINKLYSNILYTQQSNYFDVPTDCPQRDERLGWTGDAQIYIKSAAYNSDIASFHTKWITDLNDAQFNNGAFPIYAPMPKKDDVATIRASDRFSPGWAEAGIICPYTIYNMYGDTKILHSSWPFMVKYMDFLESKAGGQYFFTESTFGNISPKGGFGDWLSIGKKTPPDLLASLYYGYCAGLMAEMAKAIGKNVEAEKFGSLKEKIKTAFKKHYTHEDGKFKTDSSAYGNGAGYVDGKLGFDGHTQTAYANAIYMDMLSDKNKQQAGVFLTELLKANDYKLTTGFLGFKPLIPALSIVGNTELAYQLLLDERYPSLGFEVVNGATTIWERWNSFTKDKGFGNNASMNSFNHYSFGAVNEWMFESMGGLKTDAPGFRTFIIKPEIASVGITSANITYRSINGMIANSWKRKANIYTQETTVPANTRATIFLPAKSIARVTLNGNLLSTIKGIKIGALANGSIEINVGSGKYQFKSEL